METAVQAGLIVEIFADDVDGIARCELSEGQWERRLEWLGKWEQNRLDLCANQ